jgi:hypothetical protein
MVGVVILKECTRLARFPLLVSTRCRSLRDLSLSPGRSDVLSAGIADRSWAKELAQE